MPTLYNPVIERSGDCLRIKGDYIEDNGTVHLDYKVTGIAKVIVAGDPGQLVAMNKHSLVQCVIVLRALTQRERELSVEAPERQRFR